MSPVMATEPGNPVIVARAEHKKSLALQPSDAGGAVHDEVTHG
jgi:hypothetical protein